MNVPKKERDQAILNVFYDTMSECRASGSISVDELINRSMQKKAPKFFVCPSRTARFISLIHRGKPLPITNQRKIKMYHEIYSRLLKKCGKGPIDYTLIEEVINEEAPEFYVCKEVFKKRIYIAINSRKCIG